MTERDGQLGCNNDNTEAGDVLVEIAVLYRVEVPIVCLHIENIMHDSSIGLGHQPFTLVRRVRFPYRVP